MGMTFIFDMKHFKRKKTFYDTLSSGVFQKEKLASVDSCESNR
jgi:hypothetical protein